MNYLSRICNLRKEMETQQLDGVLITNLRNIRYLSGFSGSSAILLITGSNAMLFTDGRYTIQANQEAPDYDVVVPTRYGEDPLADSISGLKRLGFESQHVTVMTHSRWEVRFGEDVTLIPCDEIVEPMRLVKDKDELSIIKRACEIADRSYEAILSKIQVGMSENDLCTELEYQMKLLGSKRPSFDTIIASGERSAMPHAEPTSRILQAGDFITMDFGAEVDGYCSDITRTVALGPVNEELRKIYDIVLNAQIAATEAVKPGMTGKEVDAVARNIIAAEGYADKFQHGLGHSLGLEVHDGHGLSAGSDLVLQPGMVMTVEPGIYIDGLGGVRIEDDVVVTSNGCERLILSTKEYIQLPV